MVVALVAGIAVAGVAVSSRTNPDVSSPQTAGVIKAGKPVAITSWHFGYSLTGESVMSILETEHGRSGDWDPALWSIVTVLGAAIFYVACLG